MVEDDERGKRFAKRCLEHEGYTVLVADSAESAMETLEARADIKVVFSDVIMPGGGNGLELASWLRAQHPRVKVQLTTGYEELLSQRGKRIRVFSFEQTLFAVRACRGDRDTLLRARFFHALAYQ